MPEDEPVNDEEIDSPSTLSLEALEKILDATGSTLFARALDVSRIESDPEATDLEKEEAKKALEVELEFVSEMLDRLGVEIDF